MSDIAIKVENISKKYCKSLKRSMVYGIKDILKNSIGLSSQSQELREKEFWALDDISFELKRGETLGIIGPNGSGKTTLLKMLNGIFWPDKGKISIRGRVGALIEVGAGFHPLLTGRENIYVNGAILGMNKREIDKKFDAIVSFADIGDFLDTPVKFYSSGMFVRLGFAIAVHCEPDILLIDEVLAVGDILFQNKCFERIRTMKKKGITIILISHDLHKIIYHTDKAIMLSSGEMKAIGDSRTVVRKFKQIMNERSIKIPIVEMPKVVKRFGSGAAEVISAELFDMHNNKTHNFQSSAKVILKAKIKFYEDVQDPIVGFIISNEEGILLHNTHTFLENKKLGKVMANQLISVVFSFTANLLSGVYHITPAVSY